MRYPIHTYKHILETLKKIEVEDARLRAIKSRLVIIGVLLGLLTIGIFFQTSFNKISMMELLTSYGATIILGPVFGFVYYSTQADLVSDRKQEFWNSLIKNFSNDKSLKFTNREIDETELRKVLIEKINEKINEALKYEQ